MKDLSKKELKAAARRALAEWAQGPREVRGPMPRFHIDPKARQEIDRIEARALKGLRRHEREAKRRRSRPSR